MLARRENAPLKYRLLGVAELAAGEIRTVEIGAFGARSPMKEIR